MRQRAKTLVVAFLALGIFGPATAGGPGLPTRDAVQMRVGGYFPSGGGDVWNENETVFTLEADDFNDAIFGLSYVRSLGNSIEFGVNMDFYDSSALSSYQEFVDGAGFPIFHDTRLEMVPLTLDFRVLPGGRYEQPTPDTRTLKPIFYLGAGLGITVWEYRESGDFIDFSDPGFPIFFADFQDDGVAFESHVLAGIELPMGPQWSLLFEGRYAWADDDLNNADFPDFGTLELGGPSATVGASIRF